MAGDITQTTKYLLQAVRDYDASGDRVVLDRDAPGEGFVTPLVLSQEAVNIDSGKLQIGGVAVTATAAEINRLPALIDAAPGGAGRLPGKEKYLVSVAINREYPLNEIPMLNTLQVFRNGQLLTWDDDYIVVDNVVTISIPDLKENDKLLMYYWY